MAKSDKTYEPAELRRLAEERVSNKKTSLPSGEVDSQRLIHELEVHQIELEMQNDALKKAHEETLDALSRETKIKAHLEELVAARTADLALALDAAEAASRAKTRFLAVMSHELRTPINGMMGMTDLALRRATDAQQINWLNKGKVSAQHLLDVISDILDIAKIESGRLALQETDFSLGQTIAEVIDLQRATAERKGLNLVVQIAPDLLATLRGDALRLKQILINFVGNAIKFSENGQITVAAGIAKEDGAGVLLRLEVVDQGMGLSKEQQAQLFHAFTQVDDSMTRKAGGTGLGLAISKQLAHLMGGEVGVISVPGQGSTFWATIRVARSAIALTPHSAITESPREALLQHAVGARVLVVEDEPFNQEIAQCMLGDAGLFSDIANDGQEAVDCVRTGNYALILMDMQMPVMNGLEATRAIRAMPGKATLPIVAMTANAFDEDREKCLAAGMNDYISKPVTADVLYGCLLKWLRKSGSLSST